MESRKYAEEVKEKLKEAKTNYIDALENLNDCRTSSNKIIKGLEIEEAIEKIDSLIEEVGNISNKIN